jgi:hypothetical protein
LRTSFRSKGPGTCKVRFPLAQQFLYRLRTLGKYARRGRKIPQEKSRHNRATCGPLRAQGRRVAPPAVGLDFPPPVGRHGSSRFG